MTIEDLRRRELIILECVSGSNAYGLASPTSDIDIKGVFVLPERNFYGLDYVAQVNDARNDVVFYELRRFLQLLAVNNPNILELLATPANSVIYKHPLMEQIDSTRILSKYCENTFGKFALAQIKKARGLKKKIVNPLAKQRKTPLEFCYVNYQNGSIPVQKYLTLKGWQQQYCGLTNIPHMRDIFGLYYNPTADYGGILKSERSNELTLSSIPPGEPQRALLYYNRSGYSTYCKDYREYWDWVAKRNEDRYQSTQQHGKNYDAKNMLHTFRLLAMAIEIARDQQINVHRPDREFLLQVKSGAFTYEELLSMANSKQTEMEQAFATSSLREKPDLNYLKELHYDLRKALYQQK